jgi:hypothetical protein
MVMFGWSFPNVPAVIVAGGPSVTVSDIRTIGIARAEDRCRVIAVNDAVYPCWFADYLHACDAGWWEQHNGVPGFQGIKTSVQPTPFGSVIMLVNTGNEGFDETPGCIRTGANSGYQAVHLAAQMGAKKIVVLGLDYTDDGARMHWFGTHRQGMDKFSDVVEWRRRFRGLTDLLAEAGIEVWNAGMKSTLTWLPRVDLVTCLNPEN